MHTVAQAWLFSKHFIIKQIFFSHENGIKVKVNFVTTVDKHITAECSVNIISSFNNIQEAVCKKFYNFVKKTLSYCFFKVQYFMQLNILRTGTPTQVFSLLAD